MRHLTKEMITPQCKKNIMEHFLDPRNAEALEQPDVRVKVGDLDSGDFIEVFLSLEGEKIARMTYLVFGCTGAVATSSVLSQMVPGMTLSQAGALTDDDVVARLEGAPQGEGKTDFLAIRGLLKAIENVKEN